MNMADGTPKHPYHLVDPSPWPALGSLAALILALGFALGLHPGMFGPGIENVMKMVHWWALAPGLLLVIGVMYWWWSDVLVESRTYHTAVVQLGLRYGMILFIASEVLFFAAFFWAFFDAALFPGAPNMPVRAEATGGIWPPKGISIIAPFDLPLMNTLILLLSGTTATWAHHSIIEGNQKDAVRGLLCTVLIYTSTFFMATGFHGFHVLVGTIFLIVCLFRAMKGQFKPKQHFGFEAAAWYWHFVDVVWLFLFFCIYWWGAGKAPIALH